MTYFYLSAVCDIQWVTTQKSASFSSLLRDLNNGTTQKFQLFPQCAKLIKHSKNFSVWTAWPNYPNHEMLLNGK